MSHRIAGRHLRRHPDPGSLDGRVQHSPPAGALTAPSPPVSLALPVWGSRRRTRSPRSWLSRAATKEQPESKPPGISRKEQSRLSQHVSASERLSRNHPAAEKQTQPRSPDKVTMVSTRPARRARRSAQPASERAKPVEPARERQRTAESKPPGSRKADPTPSHHGFDTTSFGKSKAG